VPRGGAAEAFDHPVHRFWQHVLRQRLVGPDPIQQAWRVFGQDQHVALRLARAIHDAFKFGEILIHSHERLIGLEPEVHDTPRSLRRCIRTVLVGNEIGAAAKAAVAWEMSNRVTSHPRCAFVFMGPPECISDAAATT